MGDWNAKLFDKYNGEDNILGGYVFRSPMAKHISKSNRELLVETCVATGACVANTYFAKSNEQLVTYYFLTSKPMDHISSSGFAQIDHCLVNKDALCLVKI